MAVNVHLILKHAEWLSSHANCMHTFVDSVIASRFQMTAL